MTYHTIDCSSESEIATITLNRPEKRNAITLEMIAELVAALGEAESGAPKVVILTGAGPAFCAGMDLAVLRAIAAAEPSAAAAQQLDHSRQTAALFRAIYSFPKPLISAVNGPALAGGCGLATLADVTLAAPDATFGYTEVRIGFMPAIIAPFVRRHIGEKAMRELLLTGRIFGAQEAQRLGLVTEIVPVSQLAGRARAVAEGFLALSPTSIRHTKELLRSFNADELDRELELAISASTRIRSTADFREGLAAFLEKRRPVWRAE
jgi:methylglutaconyl-CoA hydratase